MIHKKSPAKSDDSPILWDSGYESDMGRLWKFIENQANRFGIWITVFTGLSGAFAWLSSRLTFMKGLGWADYTTAGIAGAVLVTFALSAILIAWSMFRPRETSPTSWRFLTRGKPQSDVQDEAFKNALAATNTRMNAWVEELCNRIQSASDYRAKRDAKFDEVIEKIKQQIAIDYPNASTVAEAFKNLDDIVHLKVNRISEEIQGFSVKLNRDDLDLKHLLYFATLEATENGLSHLISLAPKRDYQADERSELTAESYAENSEFLREVFKGLTGTHRWNEFQNVMHHAEGETDRRLGALPHDQWPPGLNPVELRRYFIAALQRKGTVEYLGSQLREVNEIIRNRRQEFVSRYDERDKR